jgi:hypothetical protein
VTFPLAARRDADQEQRREVQQTRPFLDHRPFTDGGC